MSALRPTASLQPHPKLGPGGILPDLPTLAAEIVREHEAATSAARSALGHARRAGELLIEARRQVGHGGWTAWLAENFPASARTARLYMQVARGWTELGAGDNGNALPIREAARLLAEPKAERLNRDDRELLARLEADIERGLANIAFPSDHIVVATSGKWSLWIEPSRSEGFFYITTIMDNPDGSAVAEGTIRPVGPAAAPFCVVTAHGGRFPFAEAEWTTRPAGEPLDYNRWLYDSHADYMQRHVLGQAS